MHITNSDKPVEFYNLDVIISVGYRVKSLRGTQLRIWASSILREYLIKGFAINDELLKIAGGGNHFDELLARVRDIRSSEKVFWRKVLHIYATSADYSPTAAETTVFFKTVQNKMLFTATGMTAAELVGGRANALLPMMGMTSFKGKRPTLAEAKIAKNYLNEEGLRSPLILPENRRFVEKNRLIKAEDWYHQSRSAKSTEERLQSPMTVPSQ